MFNPLAWYRHRRAMKQFAALLKKFAATPAKPWLLLEGYGGLVGGDLTPIGSTMTGRWVGGRSWVPVTSTARTAASVAKLVTPYRFVRGVHRWYVLCQRDGQNYRHEYASSYYTTRREARAARRKMQRNPFMQWDSIQIFSI